MTQDKSCWDPSKAGRHDRLYMIVGSALLEFEKAVSKSRLDEAEAQAEFRVAAATVPVEILEGFLEELLTWGSSDKSLYIHPGRFSLASVGLSFLFPLAAFAILAIFALYSQLNLDWLVSACSVGIVVLALLYAAPRSKTRRRFLFAQVLSREISRRRGQGGDTSMPSTGQVIFGSFFDWGKGTSQGAARSIFH